MTDRVGFQYTAFREAIELANIDLLAGAKEYALGHMHDAAHQAGLRALPETLVEQRDHARIDVRTEPEGDVSEMVFLPPDDESWTVLVVRWEMDVVPEEADRDE